MHLRRGLPCTSMKQGNVIFNTMQKWKRQIVPREYEGWRKLLGLPLQQDLERANSDEKDHGSDEEEIDKKPVQV